MQQWRFVHFATNQWEKPCSTFTATCAEKTMLKHSIVVICAQRCGPWNTQMCCCNRPVMVNNEHNVFVAVFFSFFSDLSSMPFPNFKRKEEIKTEMKEKKTVTEPAPVIAMLKWSYATACVYVDKMAWVEYQWATLTYCSLRHTRSCALCAIKICGQDFSREKNGRIEKYEINCIESHGSIKKRARKLNI